MAPYAMLTSDDKIDDAQRRKYLTTIDTQTTRLQRLVDDLHLYSRIESGRLPVRDQDVPISEAIRQTVDDLAAHHVEILCPPHLVARADVDHLQQMLCNYVTNALKYGAAPIVVEVQRAGGSIVIAVCDHGRGVAESFTPRLFERFARGERDNDVDGSGLGLSIVRGLARAQGGDAWYETNEPQGSRFCIRLPQAA